MPKAKKTRIVWETEPKLKRFIESQAKNAGFSTLTAYLNHRTIQEMKGKSSDAKSAE